MKQKLFNIADLYILLWALLNVLSIYRILDRLSVLLLGVVLLLAVYYFYKLLQKNMLTPYLKVLSVLILMFVVYGSLYILFGEHLKVELYGFSVQNRTYLRLILTSLLPFFAFYYFSINGFLTEIKLKRWFIIILLLIITEFFTQRNELLLDDEANITNNASYLVLGLFPGFVLFRDKKILFYAEIFICSALVLMGMKRGAIIAAAICIVILLFDQVRYAEKKQRLLLIIISCIFVYFGTKYLVSYYNNNDFFQLRVQQTLEGNTSSRSILWDTFIHHYFYEETPFQMLFGLGANGTLKVSVNYAHNDWIEILINQGAVGFFIYLVYWIVFFKTLKKSRKVTDVRMAISIFFVITLSKTFFSMSYNTIQYYSSMILCFYMAKIQMIKQNENITCD